MYLDLQQCSIMMSTKYFCTLFRQRTLTAKKKQLLLILKTFYKLSDIYFISDVNTLFISNRKFDVFYTLKYEHYFKVCPFTKTMLIKNNARYIKYPLPFKL